MRELLRAGRRRAQGVWMAAGTGESPILDEVVGLAQRRGVPVHRVERAALRAMARTDAPQGILARAEPLAEADFERLCVEGRGGEPPFLLALDGVTDPHNLGALLRTAEASGTSGVVLPRHRSALITPIVTKAAAGAIEHLSLTTVAGIPAALADARRADVWTVGLHPDGPQSLFDLELGAQAVVLVLGAEGAGLSRLARQRCDVLVRIPLRGRTASLNVAAAGALACFEISRRRP